MVKLDLQEDERKTITEQAEKLLAGFSVLDSIDTSAIELSTIYIGSGGSPVREDTAVKTVTRDELLANAPEQYDGYFQIPKAVV